MTKVKKQNQNVTKLKNSIGGKTYKFEMWQNLKLKCGKTQKLKIWQNSKTEYLTKLKILNFTTQKLKMWQNSKTQDVTK